MLRIPLEIFRSFCRGGKVNSIKVKHSPNKVLAVGAEGGLLEEARYEAMILHVVDVFLLQRALPATVPQQQLVVGHFLHFLFGHRRALLAALSLGLVIAGFGFSSFPSILFRHFVIFHLNSRLALFTTLCWRGPKADVGRV